MKIIWIDGTFGSGKTAVATAVKEKIDNAHLIEFDSLQVKYKPNDMWDFLGLRYPEAKKYLIDGLVKEMLERLQEGVYDYLIIPIALINDYCNGKLITGFSDVENYHFILTASRDVWYKRISEQENRDVDLALSYETQAKMYLETHYSEAIWIDTSNMTIDSVADKIIEVIEINHV